MNNEMALLLGVGIMIIVGGWALARSFRVGITRGQAEWPGYHDLFVSYAAKYRVPASLLEAIALWEHRGVLRPRDVATEKNGTRSIGIMQINTGNLPWIARTLRFTEADLYVPHRNIETGAALLRSMVQEFGFPSAFTLTMEQRDKLIQAWSLGVPAVKRGARNPDYLAGVLWYLKRVEPVIWTT